MTRKELLRLFEGEILKGTCFSTLKELKKDKTLVEINAPRAMIAVNLEGVWRGMNFLNDINEGRRSV